jgi:hypothetical protein
LVALDVELIEGNMRGGDEDLFDEGIDSLEHGEIEHFGALLIEIRHQFPSLRHLFFFFFFFQFSTDKKKKKALKSKIIFLSVKLSRESYY